MDTRNQNLNDDTIRARILRTNQRLEQINAQLGTVSAKMTGLDENDVEGFSESRDRLREIQTEVTNEKNALETLGTASNQSPAVSQAVRTAVADSIQIFAGLQTRCERLVNDCNAKLPEEPKKAVIPEPDYKHIHAKMDRYSTYAKLIHQKATVDMTNMATNLPDIRRWSIATKELKGQLTKYLEAILDAQAYKADPVPANKKAHFAIWDKKNITDTEINDLRELLRLLEEAEARLLQMKNTLRTDQRHYLSSANTATSPGIETIITRPEQKLEDAIKEKVKEFTDKYADQHLQPGITINTHSLAFIPGVTTHFIRHEMDFGGKPVGVGVVEQSDGNFSKQTLHFNKNEIEQIPENSQQLRTLAMELVHNARVGCSNGPIKLNNTDLWPDNLLTAVATEILYRGYKANLPDGLVAKVRHGDKIGKLRSYYDAIKNAELVSAKIPEALSTLGSKEINQLAKETHTPELYKPGKLPR